MIEKQKIWSVRVIQKNLSETLVTGLTQRQAVRRANKITRQSSEPWAVVSWGLTEEITSYDCTI